MAWVPVWGACLQVKYLEPYVPSEAEKKDAALFASNVRAKMAQAMGVPTVEYSFGDTALMFAARKRGLPPADAAVESERVRREWGLGVGDCKLLMELFVSLGAGKTGELTRNALADALGVDASSAKLGAAFEALDQAQSGGVTYREFLAGLASWVAEEPRWKTLSVEEGVAELKKQLVELCT